MHKRDERSQPIVSAVHNPARWRCPYVLVVVSVAFAVGLLAEVSDATDAQGSPAITEKQAREYAAFFSKLVVEHCIPGSRDLPALRRRLAADTDFRPFEDLGDTFETFYQTVSFAVTADADVCTVDVMLEEDHHGVLFQLEHIDERLTAITETADKSFATDIDYGPNDNPVEVMTRHYSTGDGVTLKLAYPVDEPRGMYTYVDTFVDQ